MGILGWIIVGLIAGALAKMVVPGEGPGGIIGDLIVGIVGALLTGWFSYGPLSATSGTPGGSPGGLAQVWIQAQAVGVTLIYSGVVSLILLLLILAGRDALRPRAS